MKAIEEGRFKEVLLEKPGALKSYALSKLA